MERTYMCPETGYEAADGLVTFIDVSGNVTRKLCAKWERDVCDLCRLGKSEREETGNLFEERE